MDKDLLALAREQWDDAVANEAENRARMLEDHRFVELSEQWPTQVKQKREAESRPCLTINKLPAFKRQVINDIRQNRPQITVTAVDSEADPETAEIMSGLVRHIERNSSADIAYDTAADCAIGMGLGYFTIGTEYANDETFEQEIVIRRVVSPFSVYADPYSEAGDSSDWRCGFQVVTGDPDRLAKRYGRKDLANWGDGATGDVTAEGEARLCRYWWIEDEAKTLILLSNGGTIYEDQWPDIADVALAQGVAPVEGRTRRIMVPRVRVYMLDGSDEPLTEEDWPGRYIPIIPVYGSEAWVDGKRVLKSLVHDALDSQRMVNYWRTAATELVALAPKAPFIGPKNAFVTDAKKWASANTETHPYLRYDGDVMPQRQPFAGVPAGALQEALNASDDIKAILGIFDASLGARSNETSGRAIVARQREADVGTFHFADNLTRSIRHAGRVIVDLIPRVYDTARVVRIIGKDDSTQQVKLNQPTVVQQEAADGQMVAIERIYDVTAGRYDVSVSAGPSYTTQRQESASQMIELIRAFPAAAPVIGDLLAKNLDWPNADEVAKRLERLSGGGDPAQSAEQMQQMMQAVQQGQQQIEQGKQELAQTEAQIKQAIADLKVQQANLRAQEANLKAQVAQAEAQLQQREVQVEVRSMQTDQRGQQLEAQAGAAGQQQAFQIVQDVLGQVSQQIKALEGKLGQNLQPIIVPVGGGRRRVKVSRAPTGELMGDIEDVMDDGIG